MRSWYQNSLRLFIHPYAFVEEIIAKGNTIPATVVFLLIWGVTHFGWWLTNSFNPISYKMIRGTFLALVTYPVAVFTLYLVCRLFIRETRLRSFFTIWGFSYLPTLFFFAVNVGTHLLQKFGWFPGIMANPLLPLSLWTFIFLMFFWKLLLLSITLRVAGNLNLPQIIKALIVLFLITGAYWWAGLKLELFKVPFI